MRVLAAARQKSSRAQLRSLSGDGGVFVGCERPGVQNDSTLTHGRHLPPPPMSGTHRRRLPVNATCENRLKFYIKLIKFTI